MFFALMLMNLAQASIQVNVTQNVPHAGYSLGIGSALSLKLTGIRAQHTGKFLGKLIQPSGDFSKYMILDENDSTIYLSDESDSSFPSTSLQPVLRQYNQIDGTCTGYAIDHFLQEMYWSGSSSTETLKQTLSTEQGRTQLLVESINNYYLAAQHHFSINGILNQFGKRFGFSCTKKTFTDNGKAIGYVENRMQRGLPLLISFFIGPNMVNSDLAIKDYETGEVLDPRLWTPRKIGDRNSGGHSVVAVSEFETGGKKKLLMLDSDWSEPRIWDLQDYLGGRTAVAELEFYSCE